MGIEESSFCAANMLNEQIAVQLFGILPENGPIVMILDKNGNCWPSDSERFSKLNINVAFLRELCARIDDGAEPIITHHNDGSIVAAQLVAERTNCGYVVFVLPQCSLELALANSDLIEIVVNLTGLITRLIEKNNQLSELRMKQFGRYRRCVSSSS